MNRWVVKFSPLIAANAQANKLRRAMRAAAYAKVLNSVSADTAFALQSL